MSVVVHVVAVVAGVLLSLFVVVEALKTVVVPRAVSSLTTKAVFLWVRRAFDLVVPPTRSFATRDRALAFYAPVGLVVLPGVWVGLVMFGFTLIFWGTGIDSFGEAFAVSGSSVTTLGFARDPEGFHTALSIFEAVLGLGLIALLIAYLPTIYAAFSRREVLVGLLEARAGTPPTPTEWLVRATRIDGLDDLPGLFTQWEAWFMDVEESHTSLPMVVFFRSPLAARNWVTAAGCVLDTAALWASTVRQEHRTSEAQIMLRTGYLSLRHIADYFAFPYDADPAPDAPISVSREEYDTVYADLQAAGVPLHGDRDRAWRDYAGWRVNYDAVLVALARLVVAPPAPWSSDRDGDFRRPRILRPIHEDGRPADRRRFR